MATDYDAPRKTEDDSESIEALKERVPDKLSGAVDVEDADNPYAVWMQGNSARQIPLTKALDDVLPEFPDVERRKDGTGQGDRVYYRRCR